MTVEQTARIDVRGQKLSLLESESDLERSKYIDHIVELSGPSQPLAAKTKTVKVIGLDEEKRVATSIDGDRVSFNEIVSNLPLKKSILVEMLKGRTFRTER